MDYKQELIKVLKDYKKLAEEHVELLKTKQTVWYPYQAPYIGEPRHPYWDQPYWISSDVTTGSYPPTDTYIT